MISPCNADAVCRVLKRGVEWSNSIRSATIATPFLDEMGIGLLTRLDRGPANFAIDLITRPENARELSRFRWRRLRVRYVRGLHAKVYAFLTQDPRYHEAIVTSSRTLTRAALESNIELGIRVTGSTPADATLAERVHAWIHGLPSRSGDLVVQLAQRRTR